MNGQQRTKTILADNGTEYPADIYEKSSRATGSQQWVANGWMRGMLPTHSTGAPGYKWRDTPELRAACVLYSSTRNFKGYQFPDGAGLLRHYGTIEGIRTINGVFISNTGCYARGRAHCNTPSPSVTAKRASLPLTTMHHRQRRAGDGSVPGIYHIVDVVRTDDDYNGFNRLVEYGDGSFVFASREKVKGINDPFDAQDADEFLYETNTDQ